MRRIVFVVLVSSLLIALIFVQNGNIQAVKASSSIYQGDLILTGNNVTTIENKRFDINGSIIVEDNATLVLRNATLRFVQTDLYHHRMFFGKLMVGGTPRLQAINSTITSDYIVPISFIGSSSLTAFNLNISYAWLDLSEFATSTISNCVIESMYINNNYHNVAVLNSEIEDLQADRSSNVLVSNSTLGKINIDAEKAIFSLLKLRPGVFDFWSYRLNCSVAISEDGRAANVTLMNTQIDSFEFFGYWSNVTAVNSIIGSLLVSEPGEGPHATAYVTNCSISKLQACDSSCVWLTNSTYDSCFLQHSAKVYVYWYLDVHVIDSISQNVPSANVTATCSSIPWIMVVTGMTDTKGWVRLTLAEMMINATGEYPVGNYAVEATYDVYSDVTIVNITENKQITLILEGFIVPEFPLFLILPLFMIATLLAVIVYRKKHTM